MKPKILASPAPAPCVYRTCIVLELKHFRALPKGPIYEMRRLSHFMIVFIAFVEDVSSIYVHPSPARLAEWDLGIYLKKRFLGIIHNVFMYYNSKYIVFISFGSGLYLCLLLQACSPCSHHGQLKTFTVTFNMHGRVVLSIHHFIYTATVQVLQG